MANADLQPALATFQSSLPSGCELRFLRSSDFDRGFLDCLTDLTWIGAVDKAAFNERFDWLGTKGKDWYYCIVVDDGTRIVGTATLIVERKFIHELNLVGHVEDVCVAKTFQGRHLGKTLLDALNAIGKAVGVGKMSLNCSEENIEFYRKCGYETGGQQMHILHKPDAA